MNKIRYLVLASLPLLLGMTAASAAAEDARDVVMIIPHTHWEGAVFKTREEYLQIGLPNILKALDLLKKYPDYRFVLDQMCYVRPFIERYPSEAETFRTFLKQGRLQIAGGTDTMHDNNMPSGESIVRQYLLGKTWFRDVLGYDVTTGWGLDTFGHNAQMPQILKLAGMKSYWFQRGPSAPDTPSEFIWRGIDGTEVPAFWLPISYGALFNLPTNEADFARLLQGRFASLTPFTRGHERVLMAGADVWEPEEALPIMLEKFNRSQQPFATKLAVPDDFEKAVAQRKDRPVIGGELNPIFQGIYSSRIDVKQAMRDLERLLTTAEKLDVVAGTVGAPSQFHAIEDAWEPVLFNQTHDLTSGVMVDKVYEDSMQKYAHSRQLAEQSIQDSLRHVYAHADTSGKGVPIAVFNTLAWPRTDVTEVDVPFSDPAIQQFALFDGKGKSVAYQIVNATRNGDGGILQARIAFVAQDVPALGYAIYHAVGNAPSSGAPGGQNHDTTREDHASMENEFYRASFNLWNGDMTGLLLKERQWESLASPGNVVAREYDGGDFWELYGTLNGGRFTSMKREILAPRPGYTQWSSDFVGGGGAIVSGPVYSEFHITHPLGKNQFATRVRLYQGMRRIDVRTELTNQEELVRYRAVFPTSIKNGKAMHEIAFGSIERPERQEYPAQNWIDYSDGSHGVSLINEGMPGNNVTDGKLMLSLMRSARLISYGFIGGYEPGVGSDTGLGLGKKFTLNYALMPHGGDWRAALPWRAGLEFNNPLLAQTVAAHTGDLPASWGLIAVNSPSAVLSALKHSRDGSVVARIYEASGQPVSEATAQWGLGISEVHAANLIEDSGANIDASGQVFRFDLKPYEIKTFKLKVETTPIGRAQAKSR